MKIVISLLILGTLALVIKKFGSESKEKKLLESKAKDKAKELVAMAHSELPPVSTPAPTTHTTPEPAIDITRKDATKETEAKTNNNPIETAYEIANAAKASDVVAPSQALELPESVKHILDVLKLKLKFQKAKEEVTSKSKLESADGEESENSNDNDTGNDNNESNNTEEDNDSTNDENYNGNNDGNFGGGGGYQFPANPATVVATTPVTTVTPVKTPISASGIIKTNIAANVANHLATMFNGVHLSPATPTPKTTPVINGGAPAINVNVKGNISTERTANNNTGARVIKMNHHNHAPWKRH